ncbi:MAG: undecaprenyl-diphosphate phosphatase, partial [Chloroflexota bacterium]
AIAHLGTLLAVLVYFYRDFWDIAVDVLQGLFKGTPFWTSNARLGWFIVVGTIPAAAAGLTLEGFFEEIFGAPQIAAGFLLVTAALIVAGERLQSGDKPVENMGWADAIIIGIFQMFALFPGISRSGSTIVGGLIRGLDRETATRYSFLLGTPAILGAGLFSAIDLVTSTNPSEALAPMATVFAVSAVVGYFCIHFLLQWVRRRNFYPFAIYCVIFSLVYLIFFWGLGFGA